MPIFGKGVDSFNTEKKEDDEHSKTTREDHKASDDRDDASSTKGEQEQTLFEFTNLSHTFDEEEKEKPTVSKDDESASQSSVSFGSVRVREYERVIDSTNMYMGLSLGWDYNEKSPAPLPTTQKVKNHTAKYSATVDNADGESTRMKRTNGSDRYGMMIRYGYAQKELKQATKDAAKFYKQRQREAARSLVVADERNKNKNPDKPKKRMLFRSMF